GEPEPLVGLERWSVPREDAEFDPLDLRHRECLDQDEAQHWRCQALAPLKGRYRDSSEPGVPVASVQAELCTADEIAATPGHVAEPGGRLGLAQVDHGLELCRVERVAHRRPRPLDCLALVPEPACDLSEVPGSEGNESQHDSSLQRKVPPC